MRVFDTAVAMNVAAAIAYALAYMKGWSAAEAVTSAIALAALLVVLRMVARAALRRIREIGLPMTSVESHYDWLIFAVAIFMLATVVASFFMPPPPRGVVYGEEAVVAARGVAYALPGVAALVLLTWCISMTLCRAEDAGVSSHNKVFATFLSFFYLFVAFPRVRARYRALSSSTQIAGG